MNGGPVTDVPSPIDLAAMPVAKLLELHADLLIELKRREIVRSANNPIGDYAELLFSKSFGWILNTNSSADADAADHHGLRYQIKGRRLASPRGSRQLGFIRRLPERPFDYLAAILFDERFRVSRAALIPFEIVQPRAAYVDSVKAWRFMLNDAVWQIDGVRDVTAELKAVEVLI